EIRRLGFIVIAVVIAEGSGKKGLFDGLNIREYTEVLAVYCHSRVVASGCRNTDLTELIISQALAGVGGVLTVVVQGHPAHVLIGSARPEIIEIQFQRGDAWAQRPHVALLTHNHIVHLIAINGDARRE